MESVCVGVFSIEKEIKIGFRKFLYYNPKHLQNLGNFCPSLYIDIFSLERLLIGLKPLWSRLMLPGFEF